MGQQLKEVWEDRGVCEVYKWWNWSYTKWLNWRRQMGNAWFKNTLIMDERAEKQNWDWEWDKITKINEWRIRQKKLNWFRKSTGNDQSDTHK